MSGLPACAAKDSTCTSRVLGAIARWTTLVEHDSPATVSVLSPDGVKRADPSSLGIEDGPAAERERARIEHVNLLRLPGERRRVAFEETAPTFEVKASRSRSAIVCAKAISDARTSAASSSDVWLSAVLGASTDTATNTIRFAVLIIFPLRASARVKGQRSTGNLPTRLLSPSPTLVAAASGTCWRSSIRA
jgi:hypothetical protein